MIENAIKVELRLIKEENIIEVESMIKMYNAIEVEKVVWLGTQSQCCGTYHSGKGKIKKKKDTEVIKFNSREIIHYLKTQNTVLE